MRWLRQVLADEKARFLIVGGINTGVGYLIFATLWGIFGSVANYLVIATVAHFIAVAFGFGLYRRFVFSHQGNWIGAFLRYNIGVLGNLGLGLLLMVLLVQGLMLSPLLAQAIAILVIAVSNYLTLKFFSFRRRSMPSEEE